MITSPSPERIVAYRAAESRQTEPPHANPRAAPTDPYTDEIYSRDEIELIRLAEHIVTQRAAAHAGDSGTDLRSRLGARELGDISTAPPAPLLLGKLDPEGHTILYGPGGVGKGTTAAWWICQLIDAGHKVLIVDYEDHPTEWSRRITGLNRGPVPSGSVVHVPPLSAEWKGIKGAIWHHAGELHALAQEMGATYLVIDSIIPACAGADASSGKTDVTSQYAAALQQLGLPALSLGHVTKEGDARYPFGSVFWHNLARVTWSLAKSGNGESTILTHRKHNNYTKQAKTSQAVTWRDGVPVDFLEQAATTALADLITDVFDHRPISTEPMSAAEITKALNDGLEEEDQPHKPDSVSKALRRGLSTTPKLFTVIDGKWAKA